MNIIKNTNFHPGRNCGNRTESIKYIVIHYTGSEGTAANNVSYFNNGNRGASAHFFVDRSGEIREFCDPAKYYVWHCGGPIESAYHPMYGKCTNRNSIGIEICTHYNGSSWEFTAAAVNAAVELTKYLMGKFGVPSDRVIRHYDVTGKSCPRVPGWGAVGGSGEWNKFKARLTGAAVVVSLSKGDQGDDVETMQKMLIACGYSCGKAGADGSFGADTEKAVLSFQEDHGLATDAVYGPLTRAVLEADYKAGKKREEKQEEKQETPATDNETFMKTVGELARKDQEKTHILGSIILAQAILESGWGRSELAKNAKNLFGMKKSLSGNTWAGSTWGGKVYSKDTKEVYSGNAVTVNAEFRAYNSWEQSVGDHSAYLAGAKNGSALRYAGLVGCTDYKKAAEIIKAGGYATAPDYVSKLCKLVEQYGLTKYNAVQKAEKKQEEKKESAAGKTPAAVQKTKEIRIYYPGYTREESPYDSNGAGCVWHDQDGNTIVIDAYIKNSAAAKKLVQYLVDNKLTRVSFVGTHAHGDHIGGGFQLLEDKRITVTDIYVYDPASLKLAGDGTRNGRSVQGDKDYLEKFISQAKAAGAKVHYVKTGDVIKTGEIELNVYRDQPTKWSEYDTGEGWAYVNDGSICLYSGQAYYMMAGDACAADFVEEDDLTVKGTEVGHHGNNGTRSRARIFVAHGCIWAVQCNNEQGQPGSCEFTRYGSGRMREAGVPVWQLNADIRGVIRAGKATFTQAGKSVSWAVPYGKGEPEPVEEIYRVRKTWTDSKSQVGAYKILQNAKDKADECGLTVYDSKGKAVYTGKKTEPEPAKSFLVKVKTGMNVRKGPGTSYPAYRDCPVGIYTIIKTDGDWGNLKAGGWIYIAQPRWVERV